MENMNLRINMLCSIINENVEISLLAARVKELKCLVGRLCMLSHTPVHREMSSENMATHSQL